MRTSLTEVSAIVQPRTLPTLRETAKNTSSKISNSEKLRSEAKGGDDTVNQSSSVRPGELAEFGSILLSFNTPPIHSTQPKFGSSIERTTQNARMNLHHRGGQLREPDTSLFARMSGPGNPVFQSTFMDDPAREQDRSALNAIQVLRHENFHSTETSLSYRHQQLGFAETTPSEDQPQDSPAATEGDVTSAGLVEPLEEGGDGEMRPCVDQLARQEPPERIIPVHLNNTPLSDRAEGRPSDQHTRLHDNRVLPETEEGLYASRYRSSSLRILEIAVAPDNLAEFKIRFALMPDALGVAISSSNKDMLSVLQQDRCAIEEQIRSSGIANVEVCVVQSDVSIESIDAAGLSAEDATSGTDYTSAASQHSEQNTRHRRNPELIQTWTPGQSHKVRIGQGLGRSGVFV
jgi:hypothetical protein